MKTAANRPNTLLHGALLALTLLLASGCATTRDPSGSVEAEDGPAPRDMVIVASDTNTTTSWDALVEHAAAAEIVVLAEQHDDALAHRFQAALVEALVARGPVATCMEAFERDEQPVVDAYLAGKIASKTLVDSTDSRDWGGKGQWDAYYQPIVDAARAGGAPVIAANASRRFTGIARAEGFEVLGGFAEAYPAQFVVPVPIEQAAYAERFKSTMRHHAAPPIPEPGKRGNAPSTPSMPPMTEEKLEALFRAQQVWDATMADSVLNAWRKHGRALLIVGQFHTDHEGGLLLRMKAAEPGLKYLTISLQKAEATALREEDQGRADFVVYRPGTDVNAKG